MIGSQFRQSLADALRRHLRASRSWCQLQEARREGWANVLSRRAIQRKILRTRPLRTARSGETEVRILTWRRDWLNAIWAIKSFYHFAQVDWPLWIHDGGLNPDQLRLIREHFPDAYVVAREDSATRQKLFESGWNRCAEYRNRNVSARKLFDFFLLSRAARIISIDSDILFFSRPHELIDAPVSPRRNQYNRDLACAYSLSLDELQREFGLRPPACINSGLSSIWRESIRFDRIEAYLAHPKLFEDVWVTEQTLHALLSTEFGVELLPDDYVVSDKPGLPVDLVSKHYPGFFRRHLYDEGMRVLEARGFLRELRDERSDDPLTCANRVARRVRHIVQQKIGEQMVFERVLPRWCQICHRPRRTPAPSPAQVRQVLVWNVDSIGDFLWTTPTLRALRQGYPKARIALVCNAAVTSLAEANPNIDQIIAIDPRPFYTLAGLWRRLPKIPRPDVMVILEMGSRPADHARLLARRWKARHVVSTNLGLLKGLPDQLLPLNDPAATMYWPEYFLQTVRCLGLPHAPITLEAFPTWRDASIVRAKLGSLEFDDARPVVALHPSVAPYASTTKQWPAEHFVELARLLHRDGARVVLTGAIADRAMCANLAKAIAGVAGSAVLDVCGMFTARQMVALYSQLDVVVTADTAALHLSGAAGTPVVALFGATRSSMIAPRGATVIDLHLPCSPCHQNRDRLPFWPRCIHSRPECMWQISPKHVARAAMDVISGRRRTRSQSEKFASPMRIG